MPTIEYRLFFNNLPAGQTQLDLVEFTLLQAYVNADRPE